MLLRVISWIASLFSNLLGLVLVTSCKICEQVILCFEAYLLFWPALFVHDFQIGCRGVLITFTFGVLGMTMLISGIVGRLMRGGDMFMAGIDPRSISGMTIRRVPACGVPG